MIVDVANLDLAALRCFIFYNAAAVAQANKFGIICNIDEFIENLCRASRYLWLATNCTDNLTDAQFCEINDYIKWSICQDIYVIKTETPCAELDIILCGVTVSDADTACTNNLTINIIQ